MSQKTASETSAPAETAAGASPGTESKSDAQAQTTLGEFLRRYTPNTSESERNVLNDRYRVELGQPLPDFDSKTARAYAATDLSEPGQPLFALVCRPGTVQRHRAITLLKSQNHKALLPLIAAGAVELSQPEEERFVIFYVRPVGKKLSELLRQPTIQFSPHFICERIIGPLAAAINQFSELDTAHGLINADNVYFNETAMLGPCVSEPCGYSQPFYYEPLERMQAMPVAKGEGSTAQDYYSLAVLVLHILHGNDHFADLTLDNLARAIFKEGAYAALTRQKEVPEMFHDFFRGSLCQKSEDRWDEHYIKPWLNGKRYNVLEPPQPVEAIRPFEFDGHEAGTRRELAHMFAVGWDHMAVPVQNNALAQWISVSLRNKELAESITRISKTVAELGVKNDIQLSEQLMRILLMLDTRGPIRIKHLSFHVDGIDSLCTSLYVTKAQQDLQLMAKFIEFNMVSYWVELQRKGRADFTLPTTINSMLLRLDRLRACIRNSGFGFGLERMLYETNPDLPCLSPLFANYHVANLPALLKRLDKLAPMMVKQEEPLDRHIAAFIASKLNMQHEIRLPELASTPSMAGNRSVMALYLLTVVQQRSGNQHLPGLTYLLGLRLLPLLESIHSRSLRYKFKSLLLEKAQSGSLQSLADIFFHAKFTDADQAGFRDARALYRGNEMKIENYRQGTHIDVKSARMGFVIAKVVAYTGMAASLILVMKDMIP